MQTKEIQHPRDVNARGAGGLKVVWVAFIVVACGLAGGPAAHAQKYSILHSFGCPPGDGWNPHGDLVRDSAGNLYGTTRAGGVNNLGTIFEIPASGGETVLHSFAGGPTDGQYPVAGLALDSAGNLYGTTPEGGAHGYGAVFEVSAAGVETVLYSFGNFPDGQTPMAGLLISGPGNLYGTTEGGGTSGDGTVFELTPAGVETVLFSFEFVGAGQPNATGGFPLAGLLRDAGGNLYGTAAGGGAFGYGVVFELSQGKKETLLHSFPESSSDGGGPLAGLLRRGGNFYSTTNGGGPLSGGDVFKLDANDTETILLNFSLSPGAPSGYAPVAGLIADAQGNLYGTTSVGGAVQCYQGYVVCGGVAFKLSPAGQETVLHSFPSFQGDGAELLGGLISDSAGDYYGTTVLGGTKDCGTVFRLGH